MGEFKIDMTIDEILDKMNNSKANTEIMHAGPCFLQYKLQQQLLQDQEQKHRETLDEQQKRHKDFLYAQNEYNKKQLFWTRFLVIGTWFLVAATLFLKFKF